MASKASMNEALLSIADISRHFSLPESTTRYYCKRFAAFIPSVGEGRRRRYRRETLDVIAAILEQMQKSRTAAAVEEALQARFPRNALAVSNVEMPVQQLANPVPDFFPTAALQLLERQTLALEGLSDLMRLIVERLPQANTAAPALAEDNMQLHKEVQTLRTLLLASEKTQQADLEQLRRWMTRVIQRRVSDAEAI